MVDGDVQTSLPAFSIAVTQPAMILITEFTEGAGYNKAVEISNLGTTSVDLAAEGYVLNRYSNANQTVGKAVPLTGVLGANESLVIYNESNDDTSGFSAAMLLVPPSKTVVLHRLMVMTLLNWSIIRALLTLLDKSALRLTTLKMSH